MLVILLPSAPSQCYLLKDVVQAVVPRFSTHCLLDHSYQHTNTLQYLKWNPKPLLFAMLYKPAPSFPVPLDTKLFKRILYLYRINASSVLLLSVLKNSQPQSLQILLCWILRFFFFWTPVTCTLNLLPDLMYLFSSFLCCSLKIFIWFIFQLTSLKFCIRLALPLHFRAVLGFQENWEEGTETPT